MSKNINGSFKRKKVYFSQVSNVALRDNNLSLKAKGLYALIQSYITIENFTLYKSMLRKACCEGDTAFESAWKELKDKGYLIQEKHQDDNGRFYYIYDLLDTPNHTPEIGGVDKQGCGKVGVYNNTNLNNTDLNNKRRYIGENGNNFHSKDTKDNYSLDDSFSDNYSLDDEKMDTSKNENSAYFEETEDNPPLDYSSLGNEKDYHSIDKEALEYYELMPRKDGDIAEFVLIYRKMRFKYSREYLELIIDRYKKSKKLKDEDVYHQPCNFFKFGEYRKYLDENWDSTLLESEKIAKSREIKHYKGKSNSTEPQVTDEWDKQLEDLGW